MAILTALPVRAHACSKRKSFQGALLDFVEASKEDVEGPRVGEGESVWDQEYVVPYLIELTTTCKDIEAWLIRLAFLFDLE